MFHHTAASAAARLRPYKGRHGRPTSTFVHMDVLYTHVHSGGTGGLQAHVCRCAARPVLTLDILQQGTSLVRLAQILEECSVSTSGHKVICVAIDQLSVQGTDVVAGNAEAFRLLEMEQRVKILCRAASMKPELDAACEEVSFHVVVDALTGLAELTRTFCSLEDDQAVQVSQTVFSRVTDHRETVMTGTICRIMLESYSRLPSIIGIDGGRQMMLLQCMTCHVS